MIAIGAIMTARTAISDNHASHDTQMVDAMQYLALTAPDAFQKLVAEFPEWSHLRFDGAWVDTHAMGVDPEWAMWLTDAIEVTGLIVWDDGEPWATTLEESTR